jgi:hypothetical protein
MRLQLIHIFCFLLVFSISCDESLPPRQDPSNLFRVYLQQFYIYTPLENDVTVNLIAINDFDETLSERVGIDGSIVITSDRDSSVHRTFQLSPTSLIHGNYNPVKGILTIDPGDSVIIQVKWDFTDDSGGNLMANFFRYSVDKTCQQRDVAEQEGFNIFAKTRLYTQLGYAQSQLPFLITQYDRFVGPHDCTPL